MLSVRNIHIRSADGRVHLLEGLSLDVGAGEMLAIVGHSGSGKSSFLNVVAGFIPRLGQSSSSVWDWFGDQRRGLLYEGQVEVDGRGQDLLSVEQRNKIGLVLQGGLVYEHLSVYENLAIPLRARGLARAERAVRSVELLSAVGLDFRNRRDATTAPARRLSGGERQRVALARALAKEPSIFLMDEAFANLDPILRTELLDRFKAVATEPGRCAVIVTHDLADLKSSNSVLVMGQPEGIAGHRLYRCSDGGAIEVTVDATNTNSYWRRWDQQIRSALGR